MRIQFYGALLLFTFLLVADSYGASWSVETQNPYNNMSSNNSVAVNGKIYYFGGYNGSPTSGDMIVFDPNGGASKWSQEDTNTMGRRSNAGTAVCSDNRIYITGGKVMLV
ncbi:MAG: hypothetical protein KC646_12955 [Candidatus Cloacimonetes bacterium]|nr:hypothetical protein [Candidatus Cloacimonadota bacterium]